MPRIVYLSDVHTEIQGLGRLNCKFAEGDVLVLAGDVCAAAQLNPARTDDTARSCRKALDYLKKNVFPNYRTVLKVMGNHTHYDGDLWTSENIIRDYFSDIPHFHLLENNNIFVDGVLFIGCTLWTDFFKENPIAMMNAHHGMNDYRWIKYGGEPLTPHHILAKFKESVTYLENTFTHYKDIPTVLITHHAPCLESLQIPHNGLSPAFASDLSDLILDNPQIDTVIHGHTHLNVDYEVGNTRIVTNQCGYYMESCYRKFKPDKFIDIQGV